MPLANNGCPKKDLVSQIADVERASGGKASWQREVEAKSTQLAYEHWLVPRTQNFKAEFGDWEARRGFQQVNANQPIDLNKLAPLKGKEDIKETFKEFGVVQNSYDGRQVVFPTSIVGKIDSHKGFEMRSIVKSFDLLFSKSVPMLSELEKLREGHKIHLRNIEGYSHYVSKFNKDNHEFYIRFTVQSLKGGQLIRSDNQFHSAFVSSISMYEHSAEPSNDEVKLFLEHQRFRIPIGHITLPLSSESEKLIRIQIQQES